MYCPYCGASADDNASVCTRCGASFTPQEQPNQPPQQPPYQQQPPMYGQPPYYPPQGPYPPYPYGQGYQGPMVNGTPYLVMAIISTLLCSPIFGIIAIVYASKINNCSLMGDYYEAKKNANRAVVFMVLAAVISVVFGILLFVLGLYG